MDESLRHQRDTSLDQLEALIQRGHQIKHTLAVDVIRAWQQECAAAINQLSGGSKAHWLARAYSGAFLVRAANGGVVIEADATEIVDRILGVLAQGAASLSRMEDVAAASSGAPPQPRKFEFVHNAELRPVLEQAFADSRDAFARGEFGLALILSCGVIETVLTDALAAGSRQQAARSNEYRAGSGQQTAGGNEPATGSALDIPQSPWLVASLFWRAPRALDRYAAHTNGAQRVQNSRKELHSGPTVGSQLPAASFEERIAAAERAGLIRGGCARLPPVARRYRDLTDADGELRAGMTVSEREAQLASQVLRVVMRDLDPGR